MTIRLEKHGAIARVVLARPDALNALNGEMKDALGDIAHQLQLERELRCVVLAGEGRAFCSGSDIGTMTGFDVRAGRARLQQAHRFILGFANLDKPVIAAVRGATVGVGFSLALCSDLLIASRTAKFGLVFKKVGLAPDGGIAYFLTHAIGARRAKELMLSARLFDAEEAQRLGLVGEVVDDDALDARAMALAEELAGSATFALAMGKRMFHGAAKPSLEDFLELESHIQTEVLQTADHREGASAFREKRAPQFKGY
jgi:2-(1,2-epoxy-1,2-dihydrophenyl)acetyl-CoA isomerase